MHTVTMFFDHNEWLNQHSHAAYLAGVTYADVPADVADKIVKAGLGEIVPDSIMDDGYDYTPDVEKPRRRKVSKKW